MKLFNIGLLLMVMAVVVLPVVALLNPVNQDFVLCAFYFCGLLELIGLIFVLIHIVKIKNKTP